MPYELQRNFSSGELSPRMHYRNDRREHFQGLDKCRNMIPLPWGPAQRRHGFEFIEHIDEDIDFARLFEFEVNNSISYVIAVSENNVSVVDKMGYSVINNLAVNGDFLDVSGWSLRNNVQMLTGVCYLRRDVGTLAAIYQSIPTTAATDYRVRIRINSTEEVRIMVGVTDGGTENLDFMAKGPVIDFQFTANNTFHYVEVRAEAGDGPTIEVTSFEFHNVADIASFVTWASPWSKEEIIAMQSDMIPNNKIRYFVTKGGAMYKLERADADTWTFVPFVPTFGANPDPWAANNTPGAITFHQGRMYLGGTPNEPVGIWASKPAAYEDFDFGNPSAQVPGDALILPLDKNGEIMWMTSSDNLFVGLDNGEHVIYGIAGPVDVDNAQTEQHSAYGSSRVQALKINEQIVYVNSEGRTIRAMDFDERTEKWVSAQSSFIAEHITEGRVVNIAYGSAPFGIMWGVTLDGDLVSMCVEKDQGTVGWARHTTQGRVLSVAVVKEDGRHYPWITVFRDGNVYIERYDWDSDESMDSKKTYSDSTAKSVWPGFEHLADQTVKVYRDGVYDEERIVDSSGNITLDRDANLISAGLGAPCQFRTLPPIDERPEGNSVIHLKAWSSIIIALQNSARPYVNGVDQAKRSPATLMDTQEPYKTEIIEVGAEGWSREAYINVTLDDPHPLTIIAIGGKLSEYSL